MKKSQGPELPGRRRFLRGIGVAGAATIAAATGIDWLAPREAAGAQTPLESGSDFSSAAAGQFDTPGSGAAIRRDQAFQRRMDAALAEKNVPMPPHLTNGDEALYPNRIGNYSKGLPHNKLGEVDAADYAALATAATTGNPADFNAIPLGGTVLLVDPQAGLAFELEGTDSHQMAIPPAPALASAERAGEAVELYWQALLRDVPFSQYDNPLLTGAAIADLNALSDFRGPRAGGVVTPVTLFRGFTNADLIGPYISQFFFPTLQYGAAEVVRQYLTYLPVAGGGADYLTTFASCCERKTDKRRSDPISSIVSGATCDAAAISRHTFTSTYCSKRTSTPASI